MNRQHSLAVLFVLTLVGCDQPFGGAEVDQPRYKLIEVQSGDVFRLDSETGAVTLVTIEGMKELTYETPLLEIGGYYKLEDSIAGESGYLKYLGGGKFEESEFAILKSDN